MTVDHGGSVRTRNGGAQGFASFNELSMLPRMVRQADQQARLAMDACDAQAAWHKRPEPQGAVGAGSDATSLEEALEWLGQWHARALAYDERIVAVQSTLMQRLGTLRLATKERGYQERPISETRLQLVVQSRRAIFSQFAVEFVGTAGTWQGLREQVSAVDAACRRAIAMLDAKRVDPGRYAVVLDPNLAGVFIHEAFGHLSEADNLINNPTMAQALEIGAEVAPPFVNVYDVGDIVDCQGCYRFDDEGIPPMRVDLLKNGRVAGRMHSLETARRLGAPPTGNGRAVDYRHPPIPRMRCTCLGPGESTAKEMLADLDRGLYVARSLGGQTSGGQFTFRSAEAWLVEGGKLTQPLRPVTLHGDVFTTLRQIDRVGNDVQVTQGFGGCAKQGQYPLPVAWAAPHIRVRDVLVSG